MDKEIERGRGLITRILKTTQAVKYDQPRYRLNPDLLTTESDLRYAAALDRLAGKKDRTKGEDKELREAIRTLRKRGKLARVTEEQWP